MVMKVETTISGLEGGHAVMNTYFAPVASPENDSAAVLACQRVKDALDNITGSLVNTVTYSVSPSVTVYNAATGAVVAVRTGVARTATGGLITASMASATALVAVWETGVAGPRRLIRGRTFLSGFSYSVAGNGGLPGAGVLTAGQNFVSAMLDAGLTDIRFGVWTRPVAGAGGAFHAASSGHISPKWGVLKSRRD